MQGNVWEWAGDCPQGVTTSVCLKSVLCGGSYRDKATVAISACQARNIVSTQRREDFGFRIARSLNY